MSVVVILARKAAELRENYERRLRKLETQIAKGNLKGKNQNSERKTEHQRTLVLLNKAESFRPSIGGCPQCLRCWMRDGIQSRMEPAINPSDDEGDNPDKFECRRCHFNLDDHD